MESDDSPHVSSDNESDSGSDVSVEGRRKYVGKSQGSPDRNSPKSPESDSSSSSNIHLSDNELVLCEKPSTPSVNEDKESVHDDELSSLDGEIEDGEEEETKKDEIDGKSSGKLQRYNDDNASDFSASSNDLLNEQDNEDSSDGERERKREREFPTRPVKTTVENNIPVSLKHEDLSDVSDLEDSPGEQSDNELKDDKSNKTNSIESKSLTKNPTETEDGEEQLDFEAEDGECAETEVHKHAEDSKSKRAMDLKESKKVEPEELEEGELTDEDDARPEETEPRPVCRFFSRGQCTWGASCRFLHPGVTDKGNYTMFELIRPVVPGDYGNERPPPSYGGGRHFEQPMVESAWERGLRTAKEMMKKSLKRKEQDIDFEEKKMNLSLTQEELDKENGYYARAPSPDSRYVLRHSVPVDYAPPARAPPEDYYVRRPVLYDADYVPSRERERERMRSYRDVPPRRPPDYYVSKHEEEPPLMVRRPKREVIVQRAEERPARGDEWQDPWMRSKSPVARKATRRQSYSSGTSYSSSSSSRSSSASSRSSYKSRTRSPKPKRTQSSSHKRQVSPSVIVSERKAANERAALMNPPAPRKKPPSPGMMRVGAQNPPAPSKVDQLSRRNKFDVAAALARVKRKRPSRSTSGSSSGSSSSDSESSVSSSSSSRDRSTTPRRPAGVNLAIALKAKAMDALKTGGEKRQIKLTLKNVASKKADLSEIAKKAEASQNRKRLAVSPPSDARNSAPTRKASSRREELLKQLKAVEDAIAKKRSKVN